MNLSLSVSKLSVLFLAVLMLVVGIRPVNADYSGTISGTIYDESGNPVGYTYVYAIRWVDRRFVTYTTSTATDGTYLLEFLPLDVPLILKVSGSSCHCSGAYWDGKGSIETADTIVLTASNPDYTNADFTLLAGGTLSGTIRDEMGNPVPSFSVSVLSDFGGYFLHSGCAGSDGTYSIPDQPLNTEIIVFAVGYDCDNSVSSAEQFWNNKPDQASADPVILTESMREITNVDFTLSSGGTINGTIYDEAGNPMSNVLLRILSSGDEFYAGSYMLDEDICTASDGSYSFDHLTIGRTYYLYAPGYFCDNFPTAYFREFWNNKFYILDADPVVLNAENPIVSGFDFTVDTGGTIIGVVQDKNNNPLANVVIKAYFPYNDSWLSYSYGFVCTESDGSYVLNGLPLNTPLAVATTYANCTDSKSLYARQYWENQPYDGVPDLIVLTADNKVRTGVNFTLHTEGTISGHIYDSNGPVSQIEVRLYRASDDFWIDETQTNGSTYSFSSVPFDEEVYLYVPGNDYDAIVYSYQPQYSGGAAVRSSAETYVVSESSPVLTGVDFDLTFLSGPAADSPELTEEPLPVKPTYTYTPTSTSTPTNTPTPTNTATPTATLTPESTAEPTEEVTPEMPGSRPPSAPGNLGVAIEFGQPTILWNEDIHSQWYYIYVANSNYSRTVNSDWYEGRRVCRNNVCTVTLPMWPPGGTYHVWMYAWGYNQYSTGGTSGYPGWSTVDFTLPSSPPGAVTDMVAEDTDDGVIYTWTPAANASWYNIWVGNPAPTWTQWFKAWVYAGDLGCDSGTCTLTSSTPVYYDKGTRDLWTGTYIWYVRSWGSGGMSTGGVLGAPEWAGGWTFSVN